MTFSTSSYVYITPNTNILADTNTLADTDISADTDTYQFIGQSLLYKLGA